MDIEPDILIFVLPSCPSSGVRLGPEVHGHGAVVLDERDENAVASRVVEAPLEFGGLHLLEPFVTR